MTEKRVTIEVDGQVLEAQAGVMLIEVTDAAGITVPRFCYHKKLSVSANCRMCLVDVANMAKPLPACATPVMDGMKVQTRSPKALAAQQGTMEFLLINHPLDCPICDQGGECELQDVAIAYGRDSSRFQEKKRVVKDEDLGPLIATDMTRCIHCTRCVRFGSEIAGIREMGATGRGEHMRIGTFIAKTLDHELSGNVIDLCPVGALTSKVSRFQGRAWELTQMDGIAPHDSVGSNLHLHVRRGRLLRVHPRENEEVNETWISDRDRFGFQGIYAEDRLTQPMVKEQGQWRVAGWDEALQRVAEQLTGVVRHAPHKLATLVAPWATLEEMYLAQRITRGLGSPNIDSRLRQGDFRADGSEPLYPWLGLAIAELEQIDGALVIGANLRKEQPLLAHRLRKAARAGAEVVLVNPIHLDLSHPANQLVVSPWAMVETLAGIAAALGVGANGAPVEPTLQAVAEQLKKTGRGLVLLGGLAASHPDFSALRRLAYSIAEKIGAKVGFVPQASNSVGAALAGALPQVAPGARPANPVGAAAGTLLNETGRSYLLMGFDPALDTWNPAQTQRTLGEAEFVVALTAYRTPSLDSVADVLLPIATFAETAGTYVNAEGRWQGFQGVVAPPGEARPGWKVLRVLGNLLALDGFGYNSARAVRDELAAQCADAKPDNASRGIWSGEPIQAPAGLARIGDVPIYAGDPLVRRAPALQQTQDAVGFGVWLNPEEAQRAGLGEGDQVWVRQDGAQAQGPVSLDWRIPDGCARIPTAVPGSEQLGAPFASVNLEKV